jgi:hypothetical protein
MAVQDAFQEGHALRRSMWHSFQGAFFACLLMGGQVGLVMLELGTNLATMGLLLGLLGTGIFLAVFAPFRRPSKEAAAIESAARNLDPGLDFARVSFEDFTRYTRRAISYLDDLPRLAGSPLIRLPLVAARLGADSAQHDTLSQARELRQLLIENIARLKPDSEAAFGTTDAWRNYNAVYFPYVVGLRPSRRRQTKTGLADHEAEALAWFRREVPERTLYHWQSRAVELIARSVWEQNRSVGQRPFDYTG